jgi:hypothetical protein|tara:strand:- start:220 stop:801 length:582 start_codon:yes stop_codon:yes gene_type:complete
MVTSQGKPALTYYINLLYTDTFIMNNLIDIEIAILMTASAKADRSSRNAETKALDAMQADGMVSTDFISPKKPESTASEQFFGEVKGTVVASFTKSEQKLIGYATTTNLSDKQKAQRKALQQTIGKKIGQFGRSLRKREQAEREPVISTVESRVHTKLTDVLKQVRKTEQFDGRATALCGFITQAIEQINLPK